ncbi:MAG: hypothetical protein KF819_25220 [Labilithrix sp.]|nr:hypothetical protein [Labilithrix sp.]
MLKYRTTIWNRLLLMDFEEPYTWLNGYWTGVFLSGGKVTEEIEVLKAVIGGTLPRADRGLNDYVVDVGPEITRIEVLYDPIRVYEVPTRWLLAALEDYLDIRTALRKSGELRPAPT